MLDTDAVSYAMIARVFDGQLEGRTRDDIRDHITLYGSAPASRARILRRVGPALCEAPIVAVDVVTQIIICNEFV